ncbi:glutamyl-tRNA reductase [Streptococcus cuniculi]|uniref:Glutamyl-tRNA reductase n=1 Tax=Streptococcus cuniculi TaxID=1432788 RepID=A0A4Y9JCC7_9STRE|nr:glutamyl-tRNA reductase [Streptococcus cuniculi]MBF0777630.1 glutamyl-tRNA reductase [Streptococcus cuniculi]TFU98670.1 glutamyl-tRNA reductase [Streptococcus cuniculi]
MYLLYVGLTHKETPLSVLEKLHFSDEHIEESLKRLYREKSILEDVIVSTCNRTELYLVVDQLHTGRYYAKHFLADCFGVAAEEIEPYLVFKEAEEVLRHLLRVSIGLESKILGETQILGQLKTAFQTAKEAGTTGIILNEVSRQVLTFAKRMHEEYRINARPISISLTAMQQLDLLDFDYEHKSIAIIGLGEIGQLVTKYALQKPFSSILLVNRTVEKAQPFLGDERVSAHAWEQLVDVAGQADVIFSAVKTGEYILFPSMLKKEAIAFDLCLPRTIHPSPDLQLYTIENLTNQLEIYRAEREEIAEKIAAEVDVELFKFDEWKKQLGIVPLIRELRERSLEAQASSLKSLKRKLPNMTAREEKQISKHMKSVVNQILKEPILQLKEMSIGENSHYDIALICKIFGLEQGKEGLENDHN